MFSRSLALLRSKSGRLGCMLAAAAALAGCGGSVVDEFNPERIVSLGDEYSYIDGATGRKYTVNQLNADGSVDCNANRIWNQQLVASYGFAFAQCPSGGDTSRALLYAEPEARVSGSANTIAAQIERHRATGGGFRKGDLVIVMAGANDIRSLAQDATLGDAAKEEAAKAVARTLAQQLNDLANAGTPVVVLSVPDQGTTPYAARTGQGDILRRLTRRFNDELNIALVNDGRKLGWVGAEGEINALQFNESPIYGVTKRSASDTACPAGTTGTGCDTSNAVPDYGNYLYAYDWHLSTVPHARLAALAETRARDNPFR